MRAGALRAFLLHQARNREQGTLIGVRPVLNTPEATSLLLEQTRKAIEGWQHYFEIEGTGDDGSVVIRVREKPPEF